MQEGSIYYSFISTQNCLPLHHYRYIFTNNGTLVFELKGMLKGVAYIIFSPLHVSNIQVCQSTNHRMLTYAILSVVSLRFFFCTYWHLQHWYITWLDAIGYSSSVCSLCKVGPSLRILYLQRKTVHCSLNYYRTLSELVFQLQKNLLLKFMSFRYTYCFSQRCFLRVYRNCPVRMSVCPHNLFLHIHCTLL